MSDAAWQIVGLEGRGRFGAVYRALGPDGEVALKRAGQGWSGVDAAMAAGRVVGSVGGSVLVAPTGWLRYADEDWAVLPWVEGAPLSAFSGPMPTRVVCEVLVAVAGALAALRGHEREVPWPPDLRPQHVRITPAGEVKVVDLWHGTVDPKVDVRRPWMAPEVVRKRPAAGSEVYGLGALAFQALSGTPLEAPETNQQRYGVQLSLAMDALAERGIPGPVIDLLGRLLAFKPADRPGADAVVKELGELSQDLGGADLATWAKEAIAALSTDAMTDPDGRIGARVRDEGPAPAPAERAVASVVPAATRTRKSPKSKPPATPLPATEPPATTPPPSASPAAVLPPATPLSVPPPSVAPLSSVPPQSGPAEDQIPTLTPPATRSAPPLASVPPEEALLGADEEAPYHVAISEDLVSAAPPPETFLDPPLPPPEEPAGGGVPWLWVGVAVAAAFVLVAIAGWAILGGEPDADPRGAVAVAPAPQTRPSPVAPAPVPPPPPAPSPEPEPPAAPEPVPASTPAPVAPTPTPPKPAPPAPAPASAPPPPPRAKVLLSGDPATVWLIAADGRRFAAPGPVEAGSYAIEATFAGAETAPAGSVDVPNAGQVILNCSVLFARCSTQ